MPAQAIVQIEEGALNVLVGHRRGKEVVVARSVRIALQDLSRAAVENALRGVGSDLLLGAKGVHVVIGERRVFHQLATLPRLNAKDALAYASREVLRQANIATRDDLLLQTRLLRRLPDGRIQVALSGFSRTLWRPIAEAFEAQAIPVLSLQTMESCLAMAQECRGPEPVGVLECNGNRARFLLCRDGVPMQVRRFLISGGTGDNEMALATQLTMELPRTMDWLRESGQPTPKRLLIGTRVGLGDESLRILSIDDATTVERCRSPVTMEDGQAVPDIGMATLLHHLANGGVVMSLLEPPRLKLPAGPAMLVTTLAAASMAVLAGMSAVTDGNAWLGAREACGRVAAELRALESSLLQAEPEPSAEPATSSPALAAALRMRRPLSRLLAEMSNCGDDRVHLVELRFASKSPTVVSGFVEGTSRQDALAALAAFHRRVDGIRYLKATGQEELDEVPTGYRFKLSLAWRNQ